MQVVELSRIKQNIGLYCIHYSLYNEQVRKCTSINTTYINSDVTQWMYKNDMMLRADANERPHYNVIPSPIGWA